MGKFGSWERTQCKKQWGLCHCHHIISLFPLLFSPFDSFSTHPDKYSYDYFQMYRTITHIKKEFMHAQFEYAFDDDEDIQNEFEAIYSSEYRYKKRLQYDWTISKCWMHWYGSYSRDIKYDTLYNKMMSSIKYCAWCTMPMTFFLSNDKIYSIETSKTLSILCGMWCLWMCYAFRIYHINDFDTTCIYHYSKNLCMNHLARTFRAFAPSLSLLLLPLHICFSVENDFGFN